MGVIHTYGDVKIFSHNDGLEKVASFKYGHFWCLHVTVLGGMDSVKPDGKDVRDMPHLYYFEIELACDSSRISFDSHKLHEHLTFAMAAFLAKL